ncbi:hypothetical protein K504DRAFT_392519 [Pleomassaria siparia CBS 279.74]|uniref:Uncharacterized protein n=1 Tax=Pleomassaria siparia CBS 279.74 TaxID=1314801 RepID=A0A6G1JS83_9PLEO|nr:hypothetical protein K504DRAFT_392519 [Pleomassaria siparia CBS 279.74]
MASEQPTSSKQQVRVYPDRRKRVCRTPTTESSPSTSDPSHSERTSVPDESTDATDLESSSGSDLSESSEEPSSDSESESESESESGEDSDEELQSDMEDEHGIVNLPAVRARKPIMKLPKDELGPDLRPFLAGFLPQLRAANQALEKEREAGTLKAKIIDDQEGVEGEGEYIEMDLGLGVFKEKNPDADDASSSSESEDEETLDGTSQLKPEDVLSKLMGRKSRKGMVEIQEVGDAPAK